MSKCVIKWNICMVVFFINVFVGLDYIVGIVMIYLILFIEIIILLLI